MRHLVKLGMIAIVLFCLACDLPTILRSDDEQDLTENKALNENLLFVEISGGIAGIKQYLLVDAAGKVLFDDSFQSGARWVARLSPSELVELKELFIKNDFFQLKNAYVDVRVADAFFYLITFTHNNESNTVTTDYFGAPANLQAIVDGLAALIQKITNSGLQLSLEITPSIIRAGEQALLKLSILNAGESPITLHFTSGQIFDFFASLNFNQLTSIANDSLVWNWAHGRFFTENVWELVLAVGDTRTYAISWDGRDNSGEQLFGELMVGAELKSVPGGRPKPVNLIIQKR
ncbi:MAG: BsuPI-related putative proteinase inhibitor [bacterium]